MKCYLTVGLVAAGGEAVGRLRGLGYDVETHSINVTV